MANAQETYFNYVNSSETGKKSSEAGVLLDKALEEWSEENKEDKEKCPYADESKKYVDALRAIEESQGADVEDLNQKVEEKKRLEKEISKLARDALSADIGSGAAAGGDSEVDSDWEAENKTKEERAYERSLEYAKKHPFLGSISLVANFLKVSWSSLWRGKSVTDTDDSVIWQDSESSQEGSGQEATEQKENLPTGDGRVYAVVKDLISKGVEGKHCWDWINKVYKSLGAKAKKLYQNLNYSGKDCGENHVKEEDLVNGSNLSLREGDWLYINNKNKWDSHGNHSVIFLGWADKENLIAKTASCPGAGRVGRIEKRNLKTNPVTHISRMVLPAQVA